MNQIKHTTDTTDIIRSGKAVLGIELGSTRIKAVLIGEDNAPLASGAHDWENRLQDGIWTYTLDDIWSGLQDSYAKMAQDVRTKYRVEITNLAAIGFSGMIEVAAFADILTLKESLEFTRNMKQPQAFQLTSCCCPVWIKLIRNDFQKIAGHLPASVSPMIACGRIAKQLHKGIRTVFIGPCLAKKAEAKEPDLQGAIDAVLTFEELGYMFDTLQVDFSKIKGEEKEHSATAGRLYARTGGVIHAVSECVEKIAPDCHLEPVFANGVADCKKLLENILNGKTEGNFFEGMACAGGCVGGPKKIIDAEKATEMVNDYAAAAAYKTPAENPYVIDLIHRLGFFTIEEFLKSSDILTRSL